MKLNKNIRRIAILILFMMLLTTLTNVSLEADASVTNPPLRPEPFNIGVVDSSVGDSVVGLSLANASKNGDQSIKYLDNHENKIPNNISSVWVSNKHLHQSNTKQLFFEAKSLHKPFYIYGDKLDIKEVAKTLYINVDLDARFQDQTKVEQSIDMVGFKFENNKIIPSVIISMNKGEHGHPTPSFDGLKKHARYYDIRVPNIVHAEGMSVNLPSSYNQVYVWEVTIYNWIEVSAGTWKRASTHHVYEVYKDPTPSNPDYNSYSAFRLDAVHLDSFDRFYSKSVIKAPYGGVITKSYEPGNTTFNGSFTLNLGWPPSASVTSSTEDPIKVYDSTVDWTGDRHSFYVEDNEWFDDLLSPGDAWVSNLGYHLEESNPYHELWQYISHQKEGVWAAAAPSEYYNETKPIDKTAYTYYVIWKLSR